MKSISKILLTVFLLGLIIPTTLLTQESSTYNLELVRTLQFNSDNQNHIQAIFKLTPLVEDFKMILSMKMTYDIGKGEKVINVQTQKEGYIKITVYGKDMPERNQVIYNLIKDRINFDTDADIRLIVFDFTNITKAQVKNMTIKYGLWEGENADVRNEKTFTFKVDNIN